MAGLVLDCSVTISWLIEDEQNSQGQEALDRVVAQGATVPTLWPLEVGNVLLQAVRRKRLSLEQRAQGLRLLRELPIAKDGETLMHAWDRTLALAELHRLTLYDATYLELSLRTALPLATFDSALARVARREGVTMLLG